MCMWVIFDQQQLLLSLKGGGQAAREEFWRVTEVGSSQEDGKDGDKLINENTRNKISINSLFDPQITYFLYLYIPPGSTESPTLRIGTSFPETHQQARQMKMDGWKKMHIIYFVGAKTTYFFMGDVILSFWESNPPAGSISWRLSHAPCWGPYSLSRPILTGDHLPLCWAVSRETWGWWSGFCGEKWISICQENKGVQRG